MRFVPTSELTPGVILGRTLNDQNMHLLLRRGIALSQLQIDAINRIDIPGVYIDDDQTDDISFEPIIDEKLKRAFAKETKSIFKAVKSRVMSQESNIEDLLKAIIEQLSKKQNCIVNIFDLKSFDDYTFQHSINVCILSIVLGIKKGLPYATLFNLAMAGLYHDIGKIYIQKSIINKPARLTDEERIIVNNHPALGVEHLKKINIHQNDVQMGILQHHERFDGEGYPHGRSDKGICLYGKIIAIADVFDAITSARPYKTPLLPSEGIEYVMSNASRHFDFEIANLFIHCVAAYPVGMTVRLSNGLTGVVAENFENFTLRPLVKVLTEDPDAPPCFINLKDDLNAQNITVIGIDH